MIGAIDATRTYGVFSPDRWVKHLNAYVYARLMWDLDAGVERLLDDYFATYWTGIGQQVRALCQATAEALPDLS